MEDGKEGEENRVENEIFSLFGSGEKIRKKENGVENNLSRPA